MSKSQDYLDWLDAQTHIDDDDFYHDLNENGASALPGAPAGGPGGPTSLTDLTDVTGTPGPGLGPVGDPGGEFPLTRIITEEDLDEILAGVAAVEWHDLDLLSGCSNYGQGFSPLRYRLALNNSVYLEGLITKDPHFQDSDVPLALAVLPPEARPGLSLMFTVPSDSEYPARVDVQSDGTIVLQGAISGHVPFDSAFLSLCGLVFSVG